MANPHPFNPQLPPNFLQSRTWTQFNAAGASPTHQIQSSFDLVPDHARPPVPFNVTTWDQSVFFKVEEFSIAQDRLAWFAIIGYLKMSFVALPSCIWFINSIPSPALNAPTFTITVYNPRRILILWAQPVNTLGQPVGASFTNTRHQNLLPAIARCQRTPRFWNLASEGAKAGIEAVKKDPRAFGAHFVLLMWLNTLPVALMLFLLRDLSPATQFGVALAAVTSVFVIYCAGCWAYEWWLSRKGM
ncbi:MAG: hypothetical protein M1836_007034 [Candelina mexicana]|nr:MAG: hypothetical protein M1836_007034 [Candelina mexicana]